MARPGETASMPGPSGRGVHLWIARVDLEASREARARSMLPAADLERAARFRFERDRRRHVASRALLRGVLGAYLGMPALEVPVEASSSGKPELAGAAARSGLRFNLSHSEDLAVLGVVAGRAIGVDVERIRPLEELELIAGHFFSASENAALRALPLEVRTEAFFTCWTRKEAYLKATGEGLSFPTVRFDVTVAPDQPARLLRIDGDPRAARRWSMRTLRPAEGYACSVAVEGGAFRVATRRWPDAQASR